MGEHKHNVTALRFANQPQQLQLAVDISETEPVQCGCGNNLFLLAYRRRNLTSVSPKNPTGKEIPLKFEVYICCKCGLELGKTWDKKQNEQAKEEVPDGEDANTSGD